MSHSRTLEIGVDVHQASMAVADVAHAHDAEGISLGTIGTRQADLDPLVRQLHSTATPLVFVYAAGPCGAWRSRDLTAQGHRGWGVAPSQNSGRPREHGPA